MTGIDPELMAEIRALSGRTEGVRELPVDDALRVTAAVKQAFLVDDDVLWWWTALRGETHRLSYDGGADGVAWIRKLTQDAGVVNLLVTDDEPAPWPVLESDAGAALDLILELRHFEYAIVDTACRWVIFDTHHNEIIVAGSLVGRAREICGEP